MTQSELQFLTPSLVRQIAEEFGTPVFVYDENTLVQKAKEVLDFPAPFGLTARFAMKASPNRRVLEIFDRMGLHLDASSGFEVQRALMASISPEKIQLTAQELPKDLKELLEKGVQFTACSLHQLDTFASCTNRKELALRFNPGMGSGHSNRTNVGGVSSSFGIWWEHLDQVKERLLKHGLECTKVHTHIGSGADPKVWEKVAHLTLAIAEKIKSVSTVNLGGGFKISRMPGEKETNLKECGKSVARAFQEFFEKTGRKLHLEIEPGTFLVGKSASLIAQVMDHVDTGKQGMQFLKLNTGMTENTRPSLYGAQHPLILVNKQDRPLSSETSEQMVVGHCCESGDIFTPKPGDPEGLSPRLFAKTQIGDFMVVEAVGAYCSSMSTKNYNSFPEAPEVLLRADGSWKVIRKKQTLAQIVQNEV